MADLAKLTRVYIKIRDAKAKLVAEFKEKEAELDSSMKAVKDAMLEYCKENNVDSVRTAEGLVYRTLKTRYWTNDWDAMNRFILENELPQFFEKRLNQTVVRTYLEENPDQLPPGLNVDNEYTITVRKA